MNTARLIARNLLWFRRTNLAVVGGVAVAVAVIAGALVVGDSVHASLRAIALERIGNTERIVTAAYPFREQLAARLGGAPLVAADGIVIHQTSGRRASGVRIYGVDDRFWRFHGRPARGPAGRDVLLSQPLARELAAEESDAILLRLERHSDIPRESLHGRKEETARTLRSTMRAALPAAALGEFSLAPRQGAVRAAFLPLGRLQEELDLRGRINVVLLAGSADSAGELRRHFDLADLGLKIRVVEKARAVQVETAGGLLKESHAAAAAKIAGELDWRTQGVFTYLANTIRAGSRSIPYSLVAATDASAAPGLVLNEWAARDLGVRAGDRVTLEYFVWKEGRLDEERAEFSVAAIVPTAGPPGDRDLAPDYPGITDTKKLRDWDPPFPMDLKRIRPADEKYWDDYRTTPKAFLSLGRGQELWSSRHGSLTSLRVYPAPGQDLPAAREELAARLRRALDPLREGLTLADVRGQALAASAGSTDFGEYFTYFSFFLMASALLLAGLFFRLGVEQRLREIGILRGLGFSAARVRAIFLIEGALLSAAGSLLGAGLATVYAALILYGLRTWWVGAVGTELLALHVRGEFLGYGAAGGIAAALISILLAMRGVEGLSPKGLLGGPSSSAARKRQRWLVPLASAAGVLAVALAGSSALQRLPKAAGFFGAGTLLLVCLLALGRAWLGMERHASITRRGWPGLLLLGFRGATDRAGRSTLSIALIASATFLLVSIEAFRHSGAPSETDPKSGTGGFPFVAESLLPLYYQPHAQPLRIFSFRLRPGEDVSCLNLYRPADPRVAGAPREFLREGRFTFQSSHPEQNPWLLLERSSADGTIPAIADANSLTYVLHKKVGDVVPVGGARLRIVAALSGSIFQSELIVAEKHFLEAFPEQEGFRFFLIDGPRARLGEISAQLEEKFAGQGFDAVAARDRLAGYHRVENTYLSTFQSLGALGLLLGTVGLAVVLLRNVLERRRELAMLRAVGFAKGRLATVILAENMGLLAGGLMAGVVCALVAIAPALAERGAQFSAVSLGALLLAESLTGFLASLAATAIALRAPLIDALNAE